MTKVRLAPLLILLSNIEDASSFCPTTTTFYRIPTFKSVRNCPFTSSCLRPVSIHELYQTQSNSKNSSSSSSRKGGYQQVGEPIDDSLCSLSRDDITRMLKDRTKARRAQNFQKADDILSELKKHFVSVNDKTKQWRADGRSFVNFDAGIEEISSLQGAVVEDNQQWLYTKAKNSKSVTERDEEYILNKLKDRYMAKLNRDYDLADDILDELRFLKNVEIDDSKRTFRVVDPFKVEYTFGGKRVNNILPDLLKEIELKVKQRASAKKKKDYDLADALLKELTIIHNVRVDDVKMEWHFMKSIGNPKKDNSDRITRKSAQNSRSMKDAESYVESVGRRGRNFIDIPDGIAIVDNDSSGRSQQTNKNDSIQVPNGTIINDNIQVPDGIIIHDNLQVPDDIIIHDGESFNESEILQHNGDIVWKSELESMTIPVLKNKLREAGLSVSGRKAELIERLIGGRESA